MFPLFFQQVFVLGSESAFVLRAGKVFFFFKLVLVHKTLGRPVLFVPGVGLERTRMERE